MTVGLTKKQIESGLHGFDSFTRSHRRATDGVLTAGSSAD